ncbi:MAG: hypothetical protein IKH39_03645 [Candidatus Methanomethylophilaceae archaeon]|nr:hypothetical protein [Candidatus Methanomethylophilaceae archaeon]
MKSGSTTRSLSGAELRERILKDSRISWTDLPADGIGTDDLSPEAVRHFIRSSGNDANVSEPIAEGDIRSVLSHLDMIKPDGRISKAAVLLFHPEPWRVVRGAFLMIGEFSEKDDLMR